jgi:streptomycin 6-kinase
LNLEARFEVLLRQWHLSESPDRPRLRSFTGITGFARRGGTDVVLKVPAVAHHLASLALIHFDGLGAVRLLESEPDGAMLIEFANPGSPLSDLVSSGSDERATHALCDVAALLHAPVAPRGGFRLVSEQEETFRLYRLGQMGRIPSKLVEQAHALFRDLAASQTDHRLLHGDLHHENIVLDKDRGWLAIDPQPLLGEREFDLAAAFRNPGEQPPWPVTSDVADRRCRIMCQRLRIDRHRLLGWVLVESVRLAIWSVDSGFDPDWSLATVEAVRPLLEGTVRL